MNKPKYPHNKTELQPYSKTCLIFCVCSKLETIQKKKIGDFRCHAPIPTFIQDQRVMTRCRGARRYKQETQMNTSIEMNNIYNARAGGRWRRGLLFVTNIQLYNKGKARRLPITSCLFLRVCINTYYRNMPISVAKHERIIYVHIKLHIAQ